MKDLLLFAAIGALSLLLTACAGGESETPPANSPTSTPAPTEAPPPVACPAGQDGSTLGLVTELRLGAGQVEFRAGQPIPMTFVYTNCGQEAVQLAFRDGQRYEFTVHTPEGQEVWRWSTDKAFTQALGEETVEPGGTVAYTEVWAQSDQSGLPVPAGRYHIQATSAACSPEAPFDCPVPTVGVLILIRPA